MNWINRTYTADVDVRLPRIARMNWMDRTYAVDVEDELDGQTCAASSPKGLMVARRRR